MPAGRGGGDFRSPPRLLAAAPPPPATNISGYGPGQNGRLLTKEEYREFLQQQMKENRLRNQAGRRSPSPSPPIPFPIAGEGGRCDMNMCNPPPLTNGVSNSSSSITVPLAQKQQHPPYREAGRPMVYGDEYDGDPAEPHGYHMGRGQVG